MKKLREWFIKEGLLRCSSLKEAKSLFPFPVKLIEQKKKPVYMINHFQKM